MGQRTDLSKILHEIAPNVYFQPPASKEIHYPCIIYERELIDTKFADNIPYFLDNRYKITAIYKDPDSDIPMKVAMLPKCKHSRHFTADNLHHDVFNLYF